jgi:hypothetical protein
MRHSHAKLPKEFDHFRTCAKYFRRLARFVDEERFVIKLIEGKHISCWLSLADKHLKTVVEVSFVKLVFNYRHKNLGPGNLLA